MGPVTLRIEGLVLRPFGSADASGAADRDQLTDGGGAARSGPHHRGRTTGAVREVARAGSLLPAGPGPTSGTPHIPYTG
ncbi:hypothetical protein [Streptomyces sp. WAC 06783]|uniref:hypothetical protein n=1 Tax=Streptomyces sp. WAC 06783 TaxID=2203211 RepID=UPI000F741613|nr:hypothetical protein [Streptomyces sp. WAC 06783]